MGGILFFLIGPMVRTIIVLVIITKTQPKKLKNFYLTILSICDIIYIEIKKGG